MWSGRFSGSEDMGCEIMTEEKENIVIAAKIIFQRLFKSNKREVEEEKGKVIRMRWEKNKDL